MDKSSEKTTTLLDSHRKEEGSELSDLQTLPPLPTFPAPGVSVIRYDVQAMENEAIAEYGLPGDKVIVQMDEQQTNFIVRAMKVVQEKANWKLANISMNELIVHNEVELMLLRQCRSLINDTNKTLVDSLTSKFAKTIGRKRKP